MSYIRTCTTCVFLLSVFGCTADVSHLQPSSNPPLIPIYKTAVLNGAIQYQYGYIDNRGRVRIQPQFGDAGYFFDGLARVWLNTGQWAYIDKSGKVVIELPKTVVYAAPAFRENRAQVNVGGEKLGIDDSTVYGGNWGYIDRKGIFVIKPQYSFDRVRKTQIFQSSGFFRNGRAMVPVEGGWGYIDPFGQLVIPGPYDRAEPFVHGVAEVYKITKETDDFVEGVEQFLDRHGNVLWED